MKSETLAIVILNWNDCKSTLECLKSILQETSDSAIIKNKLCTIYVVDNNSNDGSKDVLKRWSKEGNIKYEQNIVYIQSDKNLGYAGGNNLALRRSYAADVDYYMVINNDAKLKKNAIDCLLSTLQDEKIDLVGPVILDSKTNRVQSAGKKLDLIFGRHYSYRELNVGVKKVGYVSGSCFLMKKKVIDVIGFFEERFFLYTEDVEFCFRAKEGGLNVFCNTDCMVTHSSEGSINITKRDEARLYYQIRNNVLMSRLFTSRIRKFIYRLSVLARVLKKSFYFVLQLKLISAQRLFIAYIHGIRNIDGKMK